jgi:hypothetical protein
MGRRLKFPLTRWAGLMGLTVTLVICFSAVSSAQSSCTHYASPTGSGNGLSSSSPFRIDNFWAVARPGSTLCLLNGTYTGAMINPPDNMNGSAGLPITVRAQTDGGVLIDGQTVRTPISLVANDYWVIEGVNARNGPESLVEVGPGSDHNIVRRVVAWDASVGVGINSAIFWDFGGTHTLFEDIAAFGTGRKMIVNAGAENTTGGYVVRRAWAQWMGGRNPIGGSVCEIAYRSYNATYENVICTIDDEIGQDSAVGMIDEGHFGDGPVTHERVCANGRWYGSIGYLTASQSAPTEFANVINMSQYVDCNYLENVVTYNAQTDPQKNGLVLLPDVTSGEGYPGPGGFRGLSQIYKNGTEIGRGSSTIGSSYSVTNRAAGANVGAVPNIWNGAGTQGARVCYRYVNGMLTSAPLWPWPMNDRIMDAMTAAGRTPVDVTKTMESMFGAIPAICREESQQSQQLQQPGPVAPPTNLRVVTTP